MVDHDSSMELHLADRWYVSTNTTCRRRTRVDAANAVRRLRYTLIHSLSLLEFIWRPHQFQTPRVEALRVGCSWAKAMTMSVTLVSHRLASRVSELTSNPPCSFFLATWWHNAVGYVISAASEHEPPVCGPSKYRGGYGASCILDLSTPRVLEESTRQSDK